MKNNNLLKIFLVDDDAVYLKSLEIQFLEHGNFLIETFATGEMCLSQLASKPDVIILDYHLDGIDKNAMNGLVTLQKIKEVDTNIPVIMLSSQDKIDVAVHCMLNKASDYVVKSETAFIRLQKTLDIIFQYQKMEKQLHWYMDRM